MTTINDLNYDTEDSENDPDYIPEFSDADDDHDEECEYCVECETQKLKLIDMCSALREKWIKERTKVINLKKIFESFICQIHSLESC